MNKIISLILIVLCYGPLWCNWPELRGPNGNFQLKTNVPIAREWSVMENKNILWKVSLPETGHSGIAIWGDKLFLTCFRNLTEQDHIKVGGKFGTWVSETQGYCFDAKTGKLLWSCDLPGKRPNQVNGVFTDSTTPTPVTDGLHVWFFNAGGYMACHTMNGEKVWGRHFEVRTKHSVKQFQPFLHDGEIYYVMMRDSDDPKRLVQTAHDWDKNSKTGWPWMFVRSFDALTGEPEKVLPQGITVHSKGAIGWLGQDKVLLHARGGGHSPPEKPYGIGLSKLNVTHDLVWEREDLYFEGSHFIDDKYAYCFDKDHLNVLDLATGKTTQSINLRTEASFTKYDESTKKYLQSSELPELHKRHIITHRSNIGYGKYHFFMSGASGVLGRVNLDTSEVAYLQVPIQVIQQDDQRVYSWKTFKANDNNSSGFVVQGDSRRHGNGFGHISAATPVVLNDCVYFTTVLGTVYVIDAKAETFDENALLAVNDLGEAGQTWTLSPISCHEGRLYQRTSRDLICIGTN